jgi:transposase
MFLSKRIDDLNKLSNQESNRLENESLPALVVKGIKKNMKNFATEVKALLTEIQKILSVCQALRKTYELLVSIPGVGLRAAVGFMESFPDLTQFKCAEDLASACGLNPRLKRSGSSVNDQTRISKRGNSHMRKLFYPPALVAAKHNPTVKPFYDKLVAKGKPKKSALIACYGVIKSGKPFHANP